jgi:two-component system sensor histidine kinase DegS
MEEHIFRMVQEACENAVRHAQAKIVQITGRLLEDEISLSVEDNGNGFETKDGLGIDTLVKQKHFGLAGILKRAQLIGAEASIHSNLGIGTHIQVTWKPTTL